MTSTPPPACITRESTSLVSARAISAITLRHGAAGILDGNQASGSRRLVYPPDRALKSRLQLATSDSVFQSGSLTHPQTLDCEHCLWREGLNRIGSSSRGISRTSAGDSAIRCTLPGVLQLHANDWLPLFPGVGLGDKGISGDKLRRRRGGAPWGVWPLRDEIPA